MIMNTMAMATTVMTDIQMSLVTSSSYLYTVTRIVVTVPTNPPLLLRVFDSCWTDVVSGSSTIISSSADICVKRISGVPCVTLGPFDFTAGVVWTVLGSCVRYSLRVSDCIFASSPSSSCPDATETRFVAQNLSPATGIRPPTITA